jgi:hypothetical protein
MDYSDDSSSIHEAQPDNFLEFLLDYYSEEDTATTSQPRRNEEEVRDAAGVVEPKEHDGACKCTICHGQMDPNNVATTACGHVFHTSCILSFAVHQGAKHGDPDQMIGCPVCGSKILETR